MSIKVGWNKLRAVPAIRTGFDSRLPELPELVPAYKTSACEKAESSGVAELFAESSEHSALCLADG
ncbi:MAG: hypothetical protein ACI8P0_000599 [Planctomycetaceae bacterium]|jgi:hypothetical protein